ncbi:MAG: patatin-like phospholipase family protein [Bacteroidota bacterium]
MKQVKPTVFISYNHNDSSIAFEIRDFLIANDINVLIDESMLAGEFISDFIRSSISNSDYTLSIVSNNSLQSGWVSIETIESIYKSKYDKKKVLIACYLENDFFDDEYASTIVDKIDKEIDNLKALADRYHEQRINTNDLDNKKTRLYNLRQNITSIIGYLKSTLCIDISETKFEAAKKQLLKAIILGYKGPVRELPPSIAPHSNKLKKSLIQKITSASPKKILSIDDGGARSLISIGILNQIEKILRIKHDDSNLLLSDYFDLIGGSSTGGLIAAFLSKGLSVTEVASICLNHFPHLYKKKLFSIDIFNPRFNSKYFKNFLYRFFGSTTMASNEWKTGLCVTMKRLNPPALWFATNIPTGTYFNQTERMLASDVLLASMASPGIFDPQKIRLENGVEAYFVDGGLSTAKNPALHLFLLAINNSGELKWDKGEENLLVTSIGAGNWPKPIKRGKPRILNWFTEIPNIVLDDANKYNQLILQGMSNSPTAKNIDVEFGNFSTNLFSSEPMLSYIRYNADLTKLGLNEIGIEKSDLEISNLQNYINTTKLTELYEIGNKVGKLYVNKSHFPNTFNIWKNDM